MGKIFKALAMATAVCWPATVLAASDGDVPGRGMSKAEVRAQFGQPRHTRPAVGQPPITRWDYDGFSVYFENDTTLHSVREKQRAPAAEPSPAGGAPGEQPQTHSTLEAEVGVSPANGEEPPTEKEEIEVETFDPPRNKEEEDDETSTESDSAPGSTAVRANAEGSEERSEEDTERDARENTDDGASDEGRFRFDPATGRIVVDDPQEDEDSDASPAR